MFLLVLNCFSYVKFQSPDRSGIGHQMPPTTVLCISASAPAEITKSLLITIADQFNTGSDSLLNLTVIL